jgi:small subunit ribosomal protein S2
MLTNYQTIKKSIRKLEIIEQMEENGQIDMLTKKEALMLKRKKLKLISYLEGYRDMKKLPDMMFVVDTVKEHIAVKEARRMGMKVVAPLDTNCDPDLVDYPIPGNDDAIRSINLFCREIADACIEGKTIYAEAHGEAAPEAAEAVEAMSAAAEANVSAEEVKEIVAEAKSEEVAAPVAAEAPAPEAAAKADTKGDDLTKIKGVGKVYQGKLNDEGFYTYADVANMSTEAIQMMEDKYSFKGDFKDAVASAKELAEA